MVRGTMREDGRPRRGVRRGRDARATVWGLGSPGIWNDKPQGGVTGGRKTDFCSGVRVA